MRRIKRGEQQRQPGLLPARQPRHRRFGLIGTQAKAGEARPQFRLALSRALAHQVLQRGFIDIKLIHLMLGEIADAEFGRADQLAAARQFARQELGQRRFPLTIATEQRDPVILIDPQVQVFQDRRPAIAHRHLFHIDDRR